MTITIYHNPRCSKSRKTLQLIRDSGVEPDIVEYLSETPSAERIVRLAGLLGQPVQALLRRHEADFKEATDLPDLADDDALAAWLTQHPRVLERPIVVDEKTDKAVVGRPPENVLDLLDE